MDASLVRCSGHVSLVGGPWEDPDPDLLHPPCCPLPSLTDDRNRLTGFLCRKSMAFTSSSTSVCDCIRVCADVILLLFAHNNAEHSWINVEGGCQLKTSIWKQKAEFRHFWNENGEREQVHDLKQ